MVSLSTKIVLTPPHTTRPRGPTPSPAGEPKADWDSAMWGGAETLSVALWPWAPGTARGGSVACLAQGDGATDVTLQRDHRVVEHGVSPRDERARPE